MDYQQSPLLVYWEMTQSCPLACQHCRASAIPHRDPRELTTEEGFRFLERLARFGDTLPHLVLTGGDPLQRPDLFDLIAKAHSLGLTVAVTPAGTPHLTKEIIERFKESHVWMMALSIDGSSPARHDRVRGVDGSFDNTVRAVHWAREVGLPLQINTLVCDQTVEDLPPLYERLKEMGIAQWALFFLIQVGRGEVLKEVDPEKSEEIMRWATDMSKSAPFRIRTTEAPHYRRMVSQWETAEQRAGHAVQKNEHIRQAHGVRDGNGIMFVSHIGEIYPSGFLPLKVGSVRRDDPVEVYRSAPLLLQLRDADQLKGKCGLCEYRNICGGSRARAYAATGDPMESDRLCPYEPAKYRRPGAVVQA